MKPSKMPLRWRIAQLILADVKMWDEDSARKRLDFLLGELQIGSIMFYKGSCERHLRLLEYANSISPTAPLVAADAEWGLRMRLRDTIRFPRSMTAAATGDTNLMFEFGKEMGRQCRTMGINVDFAPVLDVNSNPLNPIIGTRAYGDNPHVVADMGIAFAKGLLSEGVMPVAKHFPGHGDTSEDSHKTLPSVNRSKENIWKYDLYPFQRYIDSDMPAIMSAHLNVPALDDSGTPSSLSHKIISGLLRSEMSFDGLIFTDALVMAGASAENAHVKALLAGNDILVMPGNEADAIAKIENAVEKGIIPESLIDERCNRIFKAKETFAINTIDYNVQNAKEKLFAPQALDLLHRLYKKAIIPIANTQRLPLGKAYAISIGAHDNEHFVSPGDDVPDTMPFERFIHPDIEPLADLDRSDLNVPEIPGDKPLIIEIFSYKTEYEYLIKRITSHSTPIMIFYTSKYTMHSYDCCIPQNATVILAHEDTIQAQKAAQSLVLD